MTSNPSPQPLKITRRTVTVVLTIEERDWGEGSIETTLVRVERDGDEVSPDPDMMFGGPHYDIIEFLAPDNSIVGSIFVEEAHF